MGAFPRSDQLFDPSTRFMRKGCDGDKIEENEIMMKIEDH